MQGQGRHVQPAQGGGHGDSARQRFDDGGAGQEPHWRLCWRPRPRSLRGTRADEGRAVPHDFRAVLHSVHAVPPRLYVRCRGAHGDGRRERSAAEDAQHSQLARPRLLRPICGDRLRRRLLEGLGARAREAQQGRHGRPRPFGARGEGQEAARLADPGRAGAGDERGHRQHPPGWPAGGVPGEQLRDDDSHGGKGLQGQHVADLLPPRAAAAGGAARAGDGLREDAPLLPAARDKRARGRLRRGPFPHRDPAAGVLLSLHGWARGAGRHRRQDLPFRIPSAVSDEAPGVADRRVRRHCARLRRGGHPVPLRRRRRGSREAAGPPLALPPRRKLPGGREHDHAASTRLYGPQIVPEARQGCPQRRQIPGGVIPRGAGAAQAPRVARQRRPPNGVRVGELRGLH
mmetsp:Transcript_3040/g.7215  ORF Transcript_3040/g.7215 Transcript_3040/m.7215 type:complete len:402 (-) Transcript_3040:708-1913(-)